MVGREIRSIYPGRPAPVAREVLLDVRGATRRGIVEGVSFRVHRGEILGLSDGPTRAARAGLDWFDEWDVRRAAYEPVLAGACGHTYGDHNIWQMWTARRRDSFGATSICPRSRGRGIEGAHFRLLRLLFHV